MLEMKSRHAFSFKLVKIEEKLTKKTFEKSILNLKVKNIKIM